MVYSSNLFVVLLPLVVALFYLIPSASGQRTYLAIASLLFIAYAGTVHLFVFMAVLIVAIVYFVLPYPYRSHRIVYGSVIATLLSERHLRRDGQTVAKPKLTRTSL